MSLSSVLRVEMELEFEHQGADIKVEAVIDYTPPERPTIAARREDCHPGTEGWCKVRSARLIDGDAQGLSAAQILGLAEDAANEQIERVGTCARENGYLPPRQESPERIAPIAAPQIEVFAPAAPANASRTATPTAPGE